jgi:hypothetical protein
VPKFLLQFQGAVIREIPVTKNELTVGRHPDNDIVIDNPAVSAHHCRVTVVNDSFFVEDLNSSNGVFLNAKKIMKAGLKNDDVIGIVKHALKFIDEREAIEPPQPDPVSWQATMLMAPEKQREVAASASRAAMRKPAIVHVVDGVVDAIEFELKGPSTYIGKSQRAHIKIKGKGVFGTAPENAAMIANRQEGYFLVALKEGYPKLNGKRVTHKELLKDGDVIEVGGTTLRFGDSL